MAADEEVTGAQASVPLPTDIAATGLADGAQGRTLRVLAVRLAALAPLIAALLFGAARIIAVTYAELTLPSDVTISIAWRVSHPSRTPSSLLASP